MNANVIYGDATKKQNINFKVPSPLVKSYFLYIFFLYNKLLEIRDFPLHLLFYNI